MKRRREAGVYPFGREKTIWTHIWDFMVGSTWGFFLRSNCSLGQFELAFELTPEQFELDFDLAAAASNSNSNSPPPGGKKKTFPSMHSRSSSERLRAVSREVRCQELIFFRIRLRGEIWHVTNASIQEIIFLLGYQRGKFIGCWTLGTRKLAKQIQKGGWK